MLWLGVVILLVSWMIKIVRVGLSIIADLRGFFLFVYLLWLDGGL